jgi:hypothetical protein
MTYRIVSALLTTLCLVSATTAAAQSVEIGAHVTAAGWSEFDGRDLGAGIRLGWKPISLVGLETEWNWYPADYPDEGAAFSGSRFEGMAAATAGPRLGRLRPFVRLGAGFLRTSEAPEPFACIAIFPPPLSCVMAAGDTLPTVEFGGGAEIEITPRTFLRFDAVDRMLKYPGPTFDGDFDVRDEGFFGHAFRFSIGGGWRF